MSNFTLSAGTEVRSSQRTYTVSIASTDTVRVTTTETIHVEHPAQPDQSVAQQPVAEPQQPQKQETSSPNSGRQQQTPHPAQQQPEKPVQLQPVQQPVAQQPVAQQSSTANYRTTPRNLDLQVMLNGTKYYFSQSEWANLSSSVRNNCTKRGVVIDYKDRSGKRQIFVVKLKMERHGSGYEWNDERDFTWEEAKEWVRTKMASGWRLPTKEEGEAMTDQYSEVNSALNAFGGDSGYYYWTSTENGGCLTWYFGLLTRDVCYVDESSCCGVRGVRAI